MRFSSGGLAPRRWNWSTTLLTKRPRGPCQCPSQLLHWQEDGRCYKPFARGPCPQGSFLHPGRDTPLRGQRPDPHRRTLNHVHGWWKENESKQHKPLGFVHCRQQGFCPPGWAFWLPTELCYPLKKQGPCQSGSIFYLNKAEGQAECGCYKEHGWKQYHWPINSMCYEHGSRGPCPSGSVFSYNSTTKTTQCSCSPQSPEYHLKTNQCYPKFSQEMCNKGQWLASHTDELPEHSMTPSVRRVNDLKKVNSGNTSNPLTCTCIPGYVYNEATKQCYREFTQGPCLKRHFFIGSSNNDIGICKLNPCSPRQLYFPEKRKCFNIHTAGPCSNGQLVIGYDPNGIGYRGRCGCSALNTPFYWQPDGKCYPHESRGPCPSSLVFSTRLSSQLKPMCICPEEHIFHNATGRCYRLFSQGPCQWNEWLVPRLADNDVTPSETLQPPQMTSACQCKPGYEYQTGSHFCEPPSMELLLSLQNPAIQQQQQQKST